MVFGASICASIRGRLAGRRVELLAHHVSVGRRLHDDLVAARVGAARQHAVEQAFAILLRRPDAGPTVVRRAVIAERDEAVQVAAIQGVLREMSLLGRPASCRASRLSGNCQAS